MLHEWSINPQASELFQRYFRGLQKSTLQTFAILMNRKVITLPISNGLPVKKTPALSKRFPPIRSINQTRITFLQGSETSFLTD